MVHLKTEILDSYWSRIVTWLGTANQSWYFISAYRLLICLFSANPMMCFKANIKILLEIEKEAHWSHWRDYITSFRRFRYLSGWRVRRGDVAHNGRQVLRPERALPLAVVPESRGVLRRVDCQVLQDLTLLGHGPVHAKDVLRSRISGENKNIFVKPKCMFAPKPIT